jgi:uncharacterized protein
MTSDPHTEANRETVRGAFEAWQAGTAPITDLFAAEMAWRIEGRSLAAGDYADRSQFIDEVLAPFARRFPAEAPFRPTRIRAIHADGAAVVVLWDGHGVALDGVPYDNSYAWIMELRDGKVVDGTAFFDSKAFDELWTRVEPR